MGLRRKEHRIKSFEHKGAYRRRRKRTRREIVDVTSF
jgi:hypothetical protein